MNFRLTAYVHRAMWKRGVYDCSNLRKTPQLSEISLVSRSIEAGCPLTDVGWDTVVENTSAGSDISGDVMLAKNGGVWLKNIVWMTECDPVVRGGLGALINDDTSKEKWCCGGDAQLPTGTNKMAHKYLLQDPALASPQKSTPLFLSIFSDRPGGRG